ncbi:MAG: iron chelate uptake ABC transporter family permease subunit [Butyricimonas faecalis]
MLDLLSGDSALTIGEVWNALTGNEVDEITRNIVLSIRLVRTIVALLIGVALSISGLQMQTVFRNPLADPYLLGLAPVPV